MSAGRPLTLSGPPGGEMPQYDSDAVPSQPEGGELEEFSDEEMAMLNP